MVTTSGAWDDVTGDDVNGSMLGSFQLGVFIENLSTLFRGSGVQL